MRKAKTAASVFKASFHLALPAYPTLSGLSQSEDAKGKRETKQRHSRNSSPSGFHVFPHLPRTSVSHRVIPAVC